MNKLRGTVYVLLSAVCFSLGGLLIKSIPWSPIAIQGTRSFFSLLVIGGYMLINKRKVVINRAVILGALFNFVMAITFVMATKMTTAANAIVLQFTEPVFVILLLWILYKKRPQKDAVLASAVVFIGILLFFFESLTAGGMIGNLLAIFSGFTYALVFLMKGFPGADFESSILLSNVLSVVVGIPSYLKESENTLVIWGWVVLLGTLQCGLSYILLSKGLDEVSPIAASLTSTIEPILNPLLVAWFYGEKIGGIAIVGACLVVGASTLYNIWQTNKQKAS